LFGVDDNWLRFSNYSKYSFSVKQKPYVFVDILVRFGLESSYLVSLIMNSHTRYRTFILILFYFLKKRFPYVFLAATMAFGVQIRVEIDLN